MAYEQRDLTGSLFKSTRKETDSHPDYNGSALIDGVSYFLDAWINTAKDGSKYMSLKMKAKDAARTTQFSADPPKGHDREPIPLADLDDEAPF